jgi:hypothetical protein
VPQYHRHPAPSPRHVETQLIKHNVHLTISSLTGACVPSDTCQLVLSVINRAAVCGM